MEHQKMDDELTHLGGGDPLKLKILMTILMPILWFINLFKKPNDVNK